MNTHPSRPTGALALALTLAVAGCAGSATPAPRTATSTPPAAATTAPAVASAQPTGGGVIRGLPALPDYPVELTRDAIWIDGETGYGALSFRGAGDVNVISVHAIQELANVPEKDVPADVAAFLESKRTDIVLTDRRAVTQSGLPAQRFRLSAQPGRTPSDLWRVVAGATYKPLAASPMEVVAVRSSQGLVLLWTEWYPQHEKATLTAFDAALANVTIR